MARNATRNSSRTGRNTATPGPSRLSQRGILVVSILAGGLVLAAGHGYTGPAALAGYGLYLLVTGKGAALTRKVPRARSSLRGIGWAAVAVAVLMALQGSTAPGGPAFGMALAAALAVALKLTGARNARRTHRNTR